MRVAVGRASASPNAVRQSASSRMRSETLAAWSWSAVSVDGGVPGQGGPWAARQVGHRDQGFPVVGGTVFQRHGRFSVFELGQVLAEPPVQLCRLPR